ncbi:unnamed protein product [Bursaphelenchus xylophilus]|uniref:glutamine--tRNA ligase n=2 Tax=Bursaphelenchus xylophilus TaxID=6326 RepID=A0A7I8X8Z9_BURXY|nr:unnamed protein product [Bursaphelenchus xylophilus]CAG9119094.1 unnamed protein product [Bursaphelenchus xylophilus]
MAKNDLEWLGLPPNKVEETLTNKKFTENLVKIVGLARPYNLGEEKVNEKYIGNFFYTLGSKLKPQWEKHLPIIVKYIANGGIKTEPQFAAAVDFLLHNAVKDSVDEEEFKKASGVGVVYTVEQIEDTVRAVIEKNKENLLSQRYSFNVGKLLGELRGQLKFADSGLVKKELDLQVFELLGNKTADELAPKPKKKAEKAPAKPDKAVESKAKAVDKPAVKKEEEEGAETMEELLKKKALFHKVGENFKTDGYVVTPKTMGLLKEHVRRVGGKVHTRFPPEPNGILHIGHAKAININFGYAKAHGGNCYLRFDDTNPEKEEEKYFTAIEEAVRWLGYAPFKITHSSDYFDQLYEWAEKLIQKGLAYVCHQRVEDIRGFEVKESPWRNRSVEENLALFRDMKHGKFDEGTATLRLKLTLEEGKVDPVAYRIKFLPHHRTGNKWCIYPTYDYTHCLCDSIENITHSLCTKEFQSRRSSYYWLCNALDIYCPVQTEFSRLNFGYTVVSKRKLLQLVDNGVVNDWDDPRLFTLTALRRRGIPPEAVNKFVAKLGLTFAESCVDPPLLDAVVRDHLNQIAPRRMGVLEPLKVTIQNFDELNLPSTLTAPDFPGEEKSSTHEISVDRVIYIEQSDYRPEADKQYRRLTKKQTVGLKHLGLILSYVSGDEKGLVVKAEKTSEQNKAKAYIHWVAKPVEIETRLYERLFKHRNPSDKTEVPGGFLSDIADNTLTIYHNSVIDQKVAQSVTKDTRFQFERVGYFALDPDTTPNHQVWNRIVPLKEDSGKN